jgi:hypothetical protein
VTLSPGFWNDNDKAQVVLRKRATVEVKLELAPLKNWNELATSDAKHKVATPVNWKGGEDVIIAGSVNNEEAKDKYPGGWKAPKPHLRIIPQPK